MKTSNTIKDRNTLRNSILNQLLFVVVPLILFVSWYGLTAARGPFYNLQDPDYIYLLNSLNIANGFPPHHVDHPGTFLQLFGATVLSLSQTWNNSTDLNTAVLSNPESYLTMLSMLVVGISVFLSFVAGVYIFNKTGNRCVALAFQASLIASPTLLLVSIRVMPEPILLIILSCSLMVYVYIASGVQTRTAMLVCAVILALLAGMGMATKITYFPLLFIPLIILPRILPRLVYIFGTIVAFYVCTIPIHKQLPYLWHWLKAIIFHIGRYGHGKEGVVSYVKFYKNIKYIFWSEPFMTLCMLMTLAVLIICFINRRKGYCKGAWWQLMLAMFVALTIQIIMVAKHPGDNRYLIPSLALCAPMFAVIYLHFKSLDISLSRISGLLFVFVIFCSMIFPVCTYDYKSYLKSHKTNSSVYGALYFFADYWAGNRYKKMIEKIYIK